MKISVIIPGRNCRSTLERLDRGFKEQSRRPDEVIYVDDFSDDDSVEVAKGLGWNAIRLESWIGPATARNRGAKLATGDVLVYIDSDCWPETDWLASIESAMTEFPDEVIMGKVRIPSSGFLADAISDLGFPGGANLGFEKVWRVDPDGYTDHISALNFAIRRELYLETGGFDERFTGVAWGCEDAEISQRWTRLGIRIRYREEVVIWHPPRGELYPYLKWHFVRGRYNYHFRRMFGPVGQFVRLRFWYAGNVVKTFLTDLRLPVLIGLLGGSFLAQQAGFLYEKVRFSIRPEL